MKKLLISELVSVIVTLVITAVCLGINGPAFEQTKVAASFIVYIVVVTVTLLALFLIFAVGEISWLTLILLAIAAGSFYIVTTANVFLTAVVTSVLATAVAVVAAIVAIEGFSATLGKKVIVPFSVLPTATILLAATLINFIILYWLPRLTQVVI